MGAEGVAAPRPEERPEPLAAAARLVVGSTGSRRHSSDTRRMRHMDLDRHNIERTGHCSLLLGFRLPERQESLEELEQL